MRPLACLAAVLSVLAACQMHAPAPAGDVSALASDEIAVTSLEGGPLAGGADTSTVQLADRTTPHPVARPADIAAPMPSTPEAAAEPALAVSPEQALCEKSKGQWSVMADSTGHVCVHTTRDSGKSCHRKGDCQGECLAQSGTCSPIMPLMGCNAILQADGTEVTLCLQ